MEKLQGDLKPLQDFDRGSWARCSVQPNKAEQRPGSVVGRELALAPYEGAWMPGHVSTLGPLMFTLRLVHRA